MKMNFFIYTTYVQHIYNVWIIIKINCLILENVYRLEYLFRTFFFSLFDSIFNTKKYAPASDEQSWLSRAILWRWILIYLILKPNLFSTHRFKIKTLCIFKESLKKNYLNIYFCRWIIWISIFYTVLRMEVSGSFRYLLVKCFDIISK